MKAYYLRLFFGGKVLKFHSFSLNIGNNLVSITETVFCFLFAYFWEKK